MSDELLRIENVTKKYGKTVANSDISFSVNAGETAVLLGPNGAGKSTIIKCIAGLLRFSGKILICGEPNKTLPAKRELGYIPELPAVYELLTVEEHLEFIRRAYRVEDDGYGNSLLERLELDDKRKKLGRELSKGMQQKLSICCALVHRPRVLISTHMIESVEDYWDVAHIMMNGRFAATKRNTPEDTASQSLEDLFFEITEGGERE